MRNSNTEGKEFPILVDTEAFKEENPDGPNITKRVQFRRFPRICPSRWY